MPNMSQDAHKCDLKGLSCINKEGINSSGYKYRTEDHKMNQMYLCSKLGELRKPEINNETMRNSTLIG